ncbi:chemotaxis protein CheW [Sporolituus thermophilus]|uniref:Purine-binding chemotaxis protein CheW n=1 Tax=Sporolituus thermophilus DSM 23256 TaxID=1123285 RepID=A0A1G7JTM2_9FIRM|nr:chemotaxis protein CheW [Sporolituus thermophilus]SDF28293.1 purine-binding chemotaxis protein CheW [Sporolituus thermophilus DSM 23256]
MADSLQKERSAFDERQLVTFFLGREEFGTDIMKVREIVRLPSVTQIPQAPYYVKGIANLRGTILPVIDGRSLLGVDCQTQDESTRVLVVDVNGSITGIIVDRVSEVARVSGSVIEAPPPVLRGSVDAGGISGVVKLNDGRRIIMVLDMDSLLDLRFMQTGGAASAAAGVAGSEVRMAAEAREMDEDQLVTFTLAGEEYAFNIMHVKEIIRAPEITKVPNTVHYIEGVVSIRNQLLPIVNLRSYFSLPDADITDSSRVIIVDMGALSVGFRVDRVQEVTRVERKIIDPPPVMDDEGKAGYIKGIAKLNNGDRLVMYLDAPKLLSSELVRSLSEKSEAAADNVQAETGSAKILVEEEQLVTFKLGKEEFAVRINDVQEVNRMSSVTHMPGMPTYVEGLVNLRGNIIPALNLRRRFGMADRERDDATRIVIVDINNRKIGLVVDAVSEVLRIERNFIDKTPDVISGGIDPQYVSGVAKLNGGQRMVLILDLEKVVAFVSCRSAESDEPVAKRKRSTAN